MGQPAPSFACPQCQQHTSPGVPTCPRCGLPLSVSLAVTRQVPLEVAPVLARLLADGLGLPSDRLEKRLLQGRGVLSRQLSMLEARWAQSQAQALGVRLEIRQWQLMTGELPAPTRPQTRRGLALGVLTVLFLSVLAAGWYIGAVVTAPPPDAGSSWHTATIRPGRLLPPGSYPPAGLPAPVAGPSIPEETLRQVGQAVVQVSVPDGFGAGFFVGGSGLLVTSYHVVAGSDDILVSTPTRTVKAQVVRRAPGWDLALLKVDMHPPFSLELADGAQLRPATPIFALARNGELAVVSRPARVAYVGRTMEATSLLELDAPLPQGSSGGPVVDQAGRVVGIVNATLDPGEKTSYAILSNYLLDGPDALLRSYRPLGDVSSRFLDLQLQSLAEVGERLLNAHTLNASQAFVTAGGSLAVVAETSATLDTAVTQTTAGLTLWGRAGDALWSKEVQAPVATSLEPGDVGRRHPTLYFHLPLPPDVHALLARQGYGSLEVKCADLRLRRIFILQP